MSQGCIVRVRVPNGCPGLSVGVPGFFKRDFGNPSKAVVHQRDRGAERSYVHHGAGVQEGDGYASSRAISRTDLAVREGGSVVGIIGRAIQSEENGRIVFDDGIQTREGVSGDAGS